MKRYHIIQIVLVLLIATGCGKEKHEYPFHRYRSADYFSKKTFREIQNPDAIPNKVAIHPLDTESPIRCGIVSHHLMIAPVIDRYFANLRSNRKVKTFIIITPKHYNFTSDFAVTSKIEWETAAGTVRINKKYTKQIIVSVPEIKEKTSAFHQEHGIGTLAPFIKKYFPAASIVQIGFDEKKKQFGTAYKLSDVIKKIIDKDSGVFLLISADFSHNANRTETMRRDLLSGKYLIKNDKRSIFGINTDNSSGLYTLMSFCEMGNLKNVHIFAHMDSGIYTGIDTNEITSYFFTFQY